MIYIKTPQGYAIMEPPWALKADFFVLYVLRIYFYFSAAVRFAKNKNPYKGFLSSVMIPNLCRLSNAGGLTKIRQKPCQVKNDFFALF